MKMRMRRCEMEEMIKREKGREEERGGREMRSRKRR